MPTPAIAYRTVQGIYEQPDGAAVSGQLRFIPSSTVLDATGNVVINPGPLYAALDGSGTFSIDLACTDVAGTTPVGWTWILTELFPGGRDVVAFALPTSSPSATDITDLIPVATVDPTWAVASAASLAALDSRLTAIEGYDFTAYRTHPFLLMGA